MHLGLLGQAKSSDVFPQGRGQAAIPLDELGTGRTPGQGLKAEGAGTGEEIQHPLAGQGRRQPIKDGFADPIRRRANATRCGKPQTTAPMGTRDYPQQAAVCGPLWAFSASSAFLLFPCHDLLTRTLV